MNDTRLLSSSANDERPRWIGSSEGSLFTITHDPAPGSDNGHVIVMLAAGGESRTGPQRLYVRAARSFANEGYRVIRVDLTGNGDTPALISGPATDRRLLADTQLVLRWVRERLEPKGIFIAGFGEGGRIATLHAVCDSTIDGLITWSLPWNGPEADEDDDTGTAGGIARRLISQRWWRQPPAIRSMSLRHELSVLRNHALRALSFFVDGTLFSPLNRYLHRDRAALFIFGDLDVGRSKAFLQRFPWLLQSRTERQGYWLIEDTGRKLATIPAHETLIDTTQRWLHQRIHGTAMAEPTSEPILVEEPQIAMGG